MHKIPISQGLSNHSESILLLIIGAQKSGTTTLFDMLSEVNCVCGSIKKEVGFFAKDVFYEKGEDWYWQQFPWTDEKQIRLEATPEYLYFPFVPKRISSLTNRKKFIVLLRDPVERCYSAWNMFKVFNKTNPQLIYNEFTKYANSPQKEAIKSILFCPMFPSFINAVLEDIDRYNSKTDTLEPSFVRRGIYYDQVKRYLDFFPLSDFLFLDQQELNYPAQVSEKISCFLGFDILMSPIKFESNKGQYYENLSTEAEAIAMLKDFYIPHNKKFFQLIGREFDWNYFDSSN